MVYQQKLVAVIKYNGKILREKDNSLVYLPFNSEYEILIKNLESRDCVVNISIDGTDVLDKQQLIVKANSSCSLEGFLKNNKVTNRFKFIQKTSKIQDYRGDRIDDGLIRIEYRFVKLDQSIMINHIFIHETQNIWFHPYWCECYACRTNRFNSQRPYYNYTSNPIIHSGIGAGGATYSTSGNISLGAANGSSDPNIISSVNHIASSVNSPEGCAKLNSAPHVDVWVTDDASVNPNAFMPVIDNAEGITVKGSESNQKLEQVYVSPLEDNAYTIVLKLSGYNQTNQPVEKPLLVKSKLKCSTCGRQSKSNTKYCPECGTFLS